MSLPPGFLDELRSRLSLGQVVGRKVMWDQRKSNQAKGDLWAPCPFHQEKTASFHVDDRKGFYYCFGCHQKGDAFSFVQETENVGFMEAIKILADEAGMTMPERDPQAQKKADERDGLRDVMEQAVRVFRLNLQTAAAAEARDYLQRRGFDDASLQRWEIGFAPPGWDGLRTALTGKGSKVDDLLKAGLVKASDKGREPYDTFRHRIMFPIRDARGRAIAFGGRAMDPADNAKYLNSPTTPLFDKSRTLFNHGPAREAAGKGHPLIVAEGYMDVIALSEGGFPAAVAPLGTAVTEQHLQLLWRIAPEPIIALDGDTAGLRAAERVIDLALPLLQAGQSLRFAIMPEGLDPDDVLKQQGKAAMTKLIEGAIPMVQLLWQSETEGRNFDSPERKAALDKALRDRIDLIKDPAIRSHYGQAVKDLLWQLFKARKGGKPARRNQPWSRNQPAWQRDTMPIASSKGSVLAAGQGVEDTLREAVILAAIIATPAILPEFEDTLDRIEFSLDEHTRIRDAILRLGERDDLAAAIATELGGDPLETLTRHNHVAISPAIRRAGEPDVARMVMAEECAKLSARRGHAREIAEVVEDIGEVPDEGLLWRLSKAAEALQSAGRSDNKDRTEYETGQNGARMNKDERSQFDALLNQINFAKGGKRSNS